MHNAADALARVLPNAQRRILEGQDHGMLPKHSRTQIGMGFAQTYADFADVD